MESLALKIGILFFAPLIAGLLIYLVPVVQSRNYKLLLVFAGSYLFAITVVHVFPALYSSRQEMEIIGMFVLVGFFLQQGLEYFSSGIEHGHIHGRTGLHGEGSSLVLLVALCVHAFLEGGILVQPIPLGIAANTNTILLGIVLHRAPAAFALMAVVRSQLNSTRKAIPYLLAFSLAAPTGLLVNAFLIEADIVAQSGLVFLYAVVCGNFLHISTTIVFESSPEHHFHAKRLAVAVLGSLVAVASEMMM